MYTVYSFYFILFMFTGNLEIYHSISLKICTIWIYLEPPPKKNLAGTVPLETTNSQPHHRRFWPASSDTSSKNAEKRRKHASTRWAPTWMSQEVNPNIPYLKVDYNPIYQPLILTSLDIQVPVTLRVTTPLPGVLNPSYRLIRTFVGM